MEKKPTNEGKREQREKHAEEKVVASLNSKSNTLVSVSKLIHWLFYIIFKYYNFKYPIDQRQNNNQKLIKNTDIVLYGESLGTGVAIEMATRYSFKSIILEAPFTSIVDIAQKKYKIYPAKFLVLDKFDNLSKIKKVTSPILIISGKKDEIIPHTHSLKLYNEANNPKDSLFVDEAMHNNLYDFDIEKKVIEFNK